MYKKTVGMPRLYATFASLWCNLVTAERPLSLVQLQGLAGEHLSGLDHPRPEVRQYSAVSCAIQVYSTLFLYPLLLLAFFSSVPRHSCSSLR